MSKFKVHAREEVSIGSTISRSKASDLPTKSSGLIFSTSLKHHPPERQSSQEKPRQGSEYHVQFLGKFEVPSPSSSKDNQVQTIDKIVSRLKDSYEVKTKKKESFSSRIRAKLTSSVGLKSSSTPSLSTEDVDFATPPSDDQLSSQSNPSLCSQESGSPDMSVRVFTSSPEPLEFSVGGSEGSKEEVDGSGATEHVQNGEMDGQRDETHSAGQANGEVLHSKDRTRNDSICSDFDTIPELASLQDSAVFQSLSGPQGPPSRRVRLVLSELTVMLVCEDSGERVMKKSVRNILSCAQVRGDPCLCITVWLVNFSRG